MKRYFLFDLDGTVADNGEGILKSAQYALDAFGIHNEPEERLRRFVGPPLHESFMELYGFSREQAFAAVEKYRERYRGKGVYENQLYPGMGALLERLSQRAVVCLATSKPEVFARTILETRQVLPCFRVVVGAELDGSRTDKAEVIQAVLEKLGHPPKEQAVMIGDRKHDILGAKKVGLESIGVQYGFAPPGELEEAGAEWIVPTVADLEKLYCPCAGRAKNEEERQMAKKVLVVVDMQNDFITGSLGTPEAQAIVPKVVEKIQGFGGTVLYTQDTHGADYLQTQEGRNLPVEHCLKGTWGWQLEPRVEAVRDSTPIEKPTFGSKGLAEVLKARHTYEGPLEEIQLVGLCTDICVISNALLLKAFLPEVKLTVDASCCAGVTPESHQRALEAMKACQIEVVNGEQT